MANKHRGYVDVELADGKIHKLRYDMNALAEVEDALGCPISSLNTQTVGLRELRALLWAGLLHEDPKLTLRGAGALVELDRMQEVADKITEALSLALGKTREELDAEGMVADQKN